MSDTSGSIWRKWDLHIHTPASYFNGYSNQWDAYIDDVIEKSTQHDIEGFATADYFTIDGYEEILKYYDKDTQILTSKNVPARFKKICIVPGIELRVRVFNGDNDSINLHVIFDSKVTPAFIRQNFLEELKFSYKGNELKLVKNNILAAGKSILDDSDLNISQDFESISEDAKEAYLRAAYRTITLEKSDIQSAIRNVNKILEKHHKKSAIVAVVVKGCGGIDSLEWFEDSGVMSRAGLIREDFSADADLLFSCSQDDIDFYLGKKSGADAVEIESRFKRLKPCVWGSDAHENNNLFHPSNGATKKYTWIKADATYEGLKQIIYEPIHRVKIQESNPYHDYSKPYFSKLSISAGRILDSAKPKFKTIDIDLNRDMIAVIGGRGSGKSLLMDVLASSFNKVSGGDVDRLKKINKNLNFTVSYKKADGTINEYKLSDDNNLDYLHVHQGQVKNIVTDHTRLDREIKQLLGIKIDDDEIVLDERIETDISRIENLISFFEQTNSSGAKTNTVEYQKARKKKYEDLIATITTAENKERVDEYRLNSLKIELLGEKKVDFDNLQVSLIDATEDMKDRIDQVNSTVIDVVSDEMDALMASLDGDVSIDYSNNRMAINGVVLDEDQIELLGTINSDTELIMNHLAATYILDMFENIPAVNYETQQTVIASNLALLNKEINDLELANEKIKREFIESGIKGDISKLFDNVTQYQSSITTLDKNIATIKSRDLELLKLITRLCNRAVEISTQLLNSRLEIDDKWQTVKDPDDQTDEQKALTHKLLEDIEVFGEIAFDTELFYGVLGSAINLTRFKPQTGKTLNNKLEEVFGVKDMDTFIDLISCKKVIKIDGKKCSLSEMLLMKDYFTIKGREGLLRMLYLDTGFSTYVSVVSQSRYLGKEPINLSVGQRGTFYVCLKLATDSFSTPLVFDQPDDDLDSDFIVKKLVPIFKQIKLYRQVIIITHNANFVVNTDVEQVIVAKNDDEVLTYVSGGIENSVIREEVYGILEGGKKAFLNREEKYGF